MLVVFQDVGGDLLLSQIRRHWHARTITNQLATSGSFIINDFVTCVRVKHCSGVLFLLVVKHVVQLRGHGAEAHGGKRLHHR